MALPTKNELRRRARAARDASTIDHDAHVEALHTFLTALDPAPTWILAYHSMAGEVDLRPCFSGTMRSALSLRGTKRSALSLRGTKRSALSLRGTKRSALSLRGTKRSAMPSRERRTRVTS